MASLDLEVADASEYLAITGRGLDDVKLGKKAWVWAGQQCKKFDTAPVTSYEFEVHATTSEKLPLTLPVVLTVGPKVDDISKASLLLYATKLIIAPPHDNGGPFRVRELVKGAVKAQARALAASMTAAEIFFQGADDSFEQAVVEKVQLELGRFGLFVYNADVNKQLVGVRKVGVQTTKVEAVENESDAVVAGAAAKANLLATKMPPWVLGLCIASAAVTLIVHEPPAGVDRGGAYYLAVSGAFFAAVAGVMAAH